MYGVLQPVVVTRKEAVKEDGGLAVEYELISGERRTRAARLAGLREIPAIIRTDAEDGRLKLELAIIENLQREDLNPVDRARSFEQLHKQFGLKHSEIGAKVGKSREYVSNCLRILLLPDEMLQALAEGKITDGHTRPLLMLHDRKEEQMTLFKEIITKKVTVRESEMIARKIAVERVRKMDKSVDPDIIALEKKIAETLGTRVHIDHKPNGGKVTISFFSDDDLKSILSTITGAKAVDPVSGPNSVITESPTPIDDRTEIEKKAEENDEDLYSLKNFSV
jgi:ParB family transcriptional regulator, chromosome partitioning protein